MDRSDKRYPHHHARIVLAIELEGIALSRDEPLLDGEKAKHIDQFRAGTKLSEIACEHYSALMLRKYREEFICSSHRA